MSSKLYVPFYNFENGTRISLGLLHTRELPERMEPDDDYPDYWCGDIENPPPEEKKYASGIYVYFLKADIEGLTFRGAEAEVV